MTGSRLGQAGLALLGVAGVAWIVAGVRYDMGALSLVASALMGAGFAVAAAAWTRPAGSDLAAKAGLAAAALGALLFFADNFLPVDFDEFLAAILLFILGVALVAARAARAGPGPLAWRALPIAAAGLLWVFLDGAAGAWWWQPGNALAAAGGAVLAFDRR